MSPRSGQAALDGTARCGCLHDAIAAGTAQLGPHIARHLETCRYILQYLRYIFAQRPQPPATFCTGLLFRRMVLHFPRQVFRQRLTCLLDQTGSLRRGLSNRLARRWNLGRLQFFQLEFQLFDLPRHFLRLTTKLHAPQLGDQQLQMLDLIAMRKQLLVLTKNQRLQTSSIESIQIRKSSQRGSHGRSMPSVRRRE